MSSDSFDKVQPGCRIDRRVPFMKQTRVPKASGEEARISWPARQAKPPNDLCWSASRLGPCEIPSEQLSRNYGRSRPLKPRWHPLAVASVLHAEDDSKIGGIVVALFKSRIWRSWWIVFMTGRSGLVVSQRRWCRDCARYER